MNLVLDLLNDIRGTFKNLKKNIILMELNEIEQKCRHNKLC